MQPWVVRAPRWRPCMVAWVLTHAASARADFGFFDRAILRLLSTGGQAYAYDLAVVTTITVQPAGLLVPMYKGQSNSSGDDSSDYEDDADYKDYNGGKSPKPKSMSSPLRLRAAPGTSTCANAAAASCPQSQCFGSSSCCLASGDCGKSDANVCDALFSIAPNGASTGVCAGTGTCSSSFPPAAPGASVLGRTVSTDGCSCPSAVAACSAGQCWGRLTCSNAAGASCTTSGMCTGGSKSSVAVGSFCLQVGNSAAYRFCPPVAGASFTTLRFAYTPQVNASTVTPDMFAFSLAPLGGCTPTMSYTKRLQLGSAPPPQAQVSAAAPAPPPPAVKHCGAKDIQAVPTTPNAAQRMLFLGGSGTAFGPVGLNVSYAIAPDSRCAPLERVLALARADVMHAAAMR